MHRHIEWCDEKHQSSVENSSRHLLVARKRQAIFTDPSSCEENESICHLEKVVYGLKSHGSKADSYTDYYHEK